MKWKKATASIRRYTLACLPSKTEERFICRCVFPQPAKEDDCGDVSGRSSLRRCRSGPDTDRCEYNTQKQTPADLPSPCNKQLAHTIPCLFQRTLPTFPTDQEGQAKFINMVDKPLNVSAGGNNFDLEPFMVLLLTQYSVHYKVCFRVRLEDKLMSSALLQARDYLTFEEPFALTVGTSPEYVVSLVDGTRNTMVFIQDGEVPRFLEVSAPNQIVFKSNWNKQCYVNTESSSSSSLRSFRTPGLHTFSAFAPYSLSALWH